MESKNVEIKNKQSTLQKLQEECSKLESNLKEQKLTNERATKDNDLLNGRILKTQQENEQQMIQVNILTNENHEKGSELKLKEEEISSLRQENMKLAKLRETIQRKLRGVEDHKAEVEQDKETLKSNIIGLERGELIMVIYLQV